MNEALRWAERAIGPGAGVRMVRRLPGNWSEVHALTIVDRAGGEHRLVLRRWARPGWEEDPEFTAAAEAHVLGLLERAGLPAPRVVAVDPEGEHCDFPALLMTRLRGSPDRPPPDWVAQLLGALDEVHALEPAGVSPYRPYYELNRLAPPAWARDPGAWREALARAAQGPPPGEPTALIHRDPHGGNAVWWRGALSGLVDWTAASAGPVGVDLAHLRMNLAVDGLDPDLVPRPDPYWDVRIVLDALPEFGVAPELETFLLSALRRG